MCKDPLSEHKEDVGGWRCACLGSDGWQCECFLRSRFGGKRHNLSDYDFAKRQQQFEAQKPVEVSAIVTDSLVDAYTKDEKGNPLPADMIMANLKRRLFGKPDAKTMFDHH